MMRAWPLLALPPALVLTVLVALQTGATGISLADLLHGSDSDTAWLVVMQIRAPRVAMAALTGLALGMAGTILQGLFRNPLADPGLTGVSSGAALMAACVIVLGDPTGWNVPLAGIAGSFAATALLYGFATRRGMTSITTMLLAGIAFGAFARALTGVLIFRANDTALRDLTFWTMGSFAGATWDRVGVMAVFLAAAAALTAWLARPLNAMLLNETNAGLMGWPVQRIKILAMVAVALAVGPAVAFVGEIGFVGVVVPHLVRLVTGPDHRLVLPGSALLGAVLLGLSDTLARVIAAPADVPVGIVTAILGTPVFVWLLMREHDEGLA
jgi:iron complex transport system permease protein